MKKEEKQGKARVRVFFGEIEGDNETVRDALRSIASAVNKTFQPEHTVIKTLTIGSDGNQKESINSAEQDYTDIDISVEDDSSESSHESPPKSPIRSKSRSKKAPSYSLVKEMNLRPDNAESLRDFYNTKKPSEQQQKVTVILYYLHRILEVEQISSNHIYTGLKEVEERIPRNISQVLRNISSRKGWLDCGDSENLKMTVTGDNFVEKDLPAGADRD